MKIRKKLVALGAHSGYCTSNLFFSIAFYLLLSNNSLAQQSSLFAPSVSLTSGYIHYGDIEYGYNGVGYTYDELYAILKVQTRIKNRLLAGVYLSGILNRSQPRGWGQYAIGGLEVNYLFVKQPKWNFSIGSGLYFGNFCACNNFLPMGDLAPPFRKSGSRYFGMGADGAIKISKKIDLFLRLGLHSFLYLNNPKEISNFTQPQIGLWWMPEY